MKELGVPVRSWVPDWLGFCCIFIVILPVTMLNGSYTGSMLEVSNTLGTNSEDITMGYYAASAGMAIAYPIMHRRFSVRRISAASSILIFIHWCTGADRLPCWSLRNWHITITGSICITS
mgnify:CR=1 FL=1